MKPDIHPEYRPVVFQDQAVDFSFLTKSTIQTDETVEWEDGNTYPLAKVEISAASHPFFTGTMRIVDTAGRVERFERRFGRRRGAPEGGAAEGDAPEGAVEEAAPEAPVAEEAPVVEEAAAEEVVVDEAPAEEVVADEAAAEDVSDGETPADDAEATED